MPSVNWDTVVTAGATAVFVTLAVEYLAKPRLEARKERILEVLRIRQELLVAIVNLSQSASVILMLIPSQTDSDVRRAFRDERQRHYARMRSQVETLHDDAGRYARVYAGPLQDLVLRYLNCMKGAVISPRTQHRQAEIIHGLGIQMAMTLDGPRMKPLARVRAFQEVQRLIKDTEQPAEVE